ncbi:glycosyltransferase [Vallicoccus soli]|uniref:Glycosyltransferase n=1 Tax=Vallicoccus soli TaxID=2339232 RepID=A0A3A3YUZ6_9ACTN|nr:glycosyltransferase [Vallicoccus soli]RJK95351.1 glycosyltransferase [Vallicoccus soli]
MRRPLRRIVHGIAPLVGREQEVELRRAVDRVLTSPLFDDAWYAWQAPRVEGGREALVRHYLTRGRFDGLTPHPLFWPHYVDRKRAGDPSLGPAADPLLRYLRVRSARYRSTHTLFHAATYLEQHPEALEHRHGPLGHFLERADDASPLPALPLDPQAPTPLVTWGEARELLHATARTWVEQEALRTRPRRTDRFDREREAALVAEHAAAPLPGAEDGDGAPLVSVVMPVWNRERLVGRAIASVQEQTLGAWELLVVDDGSTDGTPEVVARAAEQDPRVRLVRSEHVGVSRARNVGAEHARGRWVAWLDSDNAWTPHFLRTMVGALAAGGHRAGHAVLEMHASGATAYRAMQGGRPELEVINHIDLNVLVVERALLDEVGGFDTSLRRAVDYDLVLRLAQVTALPLVPVVGAVYNARDEDADRITVSEGSAWGEVVKNGRLVDWDAAAAVERVAALTTVVVPVGDDWRQADLSVESVLTATGGHPVEVAVVGNQTSAATTLLYAAMALRDRRVSFRRSPVDVRRALASNVAAAGAQGSVVVLLDGPVQVLGDGVGALVEELADSGARAVELVALDQDGAVHAAGAEVPGGLDLPVPLRHGLALDDARPAHDVPLLHGTALAVRTADLVAARGLDPIYTNGFEGPDLGLRLAEHAGGALRVAGAGAAVVAPAVDAPVHAGDRSLRTWRERWSATELAGTALYTASGLTPAHYEPTGRRRTPLVPVLVRSGERAPGRLRWSLKIAQPVRSRDDWGDLYFARSLAAALRRLDQEVVVDLREAAVRPTSYLDDVVLVIRGLWPVEAQPGRTNLLWVISHPEDVTPAELREADAAFAASVPWAQRARSAYGVAVEPLLQCTDSARFAPPPEGEPLGQGPRVLFVGNSRNVYREIVRDAVEVGARPTVYGTRWEQFVDPSLVAGTRVDNAELGRLYASAGVVLNDHWEDMREHGFLSNRLFDATAAGARVVSDAVAGIELFAGSVRGYRDQEELRGLLTRPFEETFPDEAARRATAARVRREHTFDARARTLLDRVRELRG